MTKDNASKTSVLEPLPATLNPDVDYTDWAKVTDVDDDELDRRILQDPDEGAAHLNLDWSLATAGMPPVEGKRMINMRLDADVVDWFKAQGRGYQTRMNAVLRSYMVQMTRAAKRPR